METPKLYIPPKRYTGESTVVSARLPKDMVAKLDSVARATGRNRSEVMSVCLEFALEHLVNKENKKEDE